MKSNKTVSELNFHAISHENVSSELLRAREVNQKARIFFEDKIEKLNNG